MNSTMNAASLAALLALAFAASNVSAQHDHSHHVEQEKAIEEQHDHASMDHSQMDHSSMNHGAMDHSQHEGMDHAQHHAGDASAVPRPTPAERAAAFPDLGARSMSDHGMHDDAIHAMGKFEEFGWRQGEDASAFAWAFDGWLGRDLHKLRLRAEGEREAGRTWDSSLELLYSRAFSRWWGWVAGVRHESRPGPSRSYAAIGVQGLAPYRFEVKATAYFSDSGHALLRLSSEYELLFTDRLILTPEVGFTVYGKADPARGTASGDTGLHAALGLRYEIRPDFAPYVGYEWEDGPAHDGGQWMAGLRFWF